MRQDKRDQCKTMTTAELRAGDAQEFMVIGAGPAGLTAALELVRQELRPLVIEKDGIVGGISRTESYKDFHFDMGGHRLSTAIALDDDFRVFGYELLP